MLNMKRKKISQILIIGFVISSSAVNSQIPEQPEQKIPDEPVSMIAKSFGDSIIIRFAPTSIESWLMGNSFGYDIFRYKVVSGQNVLERPVKELMTPQPLTPMKLEDIEAKYAADKYAAIVAQAIYGSQFNLNKSGENYNFLNMSTELANRYSFALFACDISVAASKSHGLIFTDRDVEKDVKYVYTVKPHWSDTISVTDSVFTFIAVADTYSVPPPLHVFARFEDKTVEISWDRQSTQHLFSAFNVERSANGGKSYIQINKNPIINTLTEEESQVRRFMYVDTVPQYNVEYFYRVRGITPFGELSKPSEVVSGKGKEILVGVNPVISGSERTKESTIIVRWEFPDDYQKEVKGFTVERSSLAEGPFNRISDTLGNEIRDFTDISPEGINYYQVCAISKSGYDYCSFPSLMQLPDSIPPDIPKGLKGVIDSLGIVYLNWDENAETDLMSYKVYRSNHPELDFVPINPKQVISESFSDTVPLNNLSGKVYYAISAVDRNYNESGRCIPLKIVKPDTIPPVSPRIINYKVELGTVQIEWIPSTSEDVYQHLIYRHILNNNNWELIRTYPSKLPERVSFRDSLLLNGENYEYMILAVDESGLESKDRQPLEVQTGISRETEEAKVMLRLTAADNGNSILIKWSSKNQDFNKLLIYKSVDNNDFFLCKTVFPNDNQWINKDVNPDHLYTYRAQIIMTNGIRMKIGEPYSVSF